MATTYPFPLREELVARLPAPDADGRRYIDVKVRGTWDGVLVIDSAGLCLGVYVRRRVEEYPLQFNASQIEDVRSASRSNRLMAQIPFNLNAALLITVFIVCPAILALATIVYPPLALVPAIACTFALHLLYRGSGFPFIRPLAALVGVAQVVLGSITFISWFSSWLGERG